MARRKWLFAIALVFAGIAIPAVALWSAYRQAGETGRRHYEEQLRLAKEEGLPTLPSELALLTRTPENQNAARRYRQILVDYQKVLDLPRKTPLPKDRWQLGRIWADRPETLVTALAEVAPFAGVLDELRTASKLSGCDFKYDLSKGLSLDFPEFAKLKDLCKILCQSAVLEALDGNWNAATDDLLAVARMSKHLRDQPFVIAGLVSVSFRSMAESAAWQIAQSRPEEPAFVLADRLVQELGPPPSLRREIGSDVVALRADADGGRPPPRLEDVPDPTMGIPALRYEAFAACIELVVRQHKAAMADPEYGPQAKARLEQVEAWADERKDLAHVIASAFASTTPMTIHYFSVSEGKVRALRAGVALLRARAQDGRFPDALPDMGKDGIDPLADQPWFYRREGDGFRLESTVKRKVGGKDVPEVYLLFPRRAPKDK
ncbi:MAG: hypothetical protein HYR64_00305 [Fimbriimonas ginsengisoli]|uniref:Uncharacterized protein n=1 Tax=Fimbriimonas ginsengisoli TaxID=1005039 RepID=A0A931PTJ7_FIMGI|nr:hypothetical protein [Fimbriimonas ginsengisoli]